jgi:hypothetical protein
VCVCVCVPSYQQVLLEALPEVERAHVHLDWEVDHVAEHQGHRGGLYSLPRPRSPIVNLESPPNLSTEAAARTPSDQDHGNNPHDLEEQELITMTAAAAHSDESDEPLVSVAP